MKNSQSTILRIGIQGGPGSFNDSAIRELTTGLNAKVSIHYLDDTESVLSAIENEGIELGQFALYNSYAGLYEESLNAIGKFRFRIHSMQPMAIVHCLMKRPDITYEELTTIMSHKEVFKQCRRTLAERFSHLTLEEGSAELTDPARVGAAISSGKLPPTTAVVSNGLIAELHDLDVVERGLQDQKDSISTFVRVMQLGDTGKLEGKVRTPTTF